MNNSSLPSPQSQPPQEQPESQSSLPASEAPDPPSKIEEIRSPVKINKRVVTNPSPTKLASRSRLNYSPELESPSKSQLDSPGPGAYDPHKSFCNGPKFSILGKQEFKHDNGTPGPGAYDHRYEKVRDSSPSFKISKSQRELRDKDKESNPGPGAYSANSPTRKSGIFFGTEEKSHQSPEPTIGPGAHDLPSGFDNKTYTFGGKLRDLAFESKKQIPGPGSYEPVLRNGSPSYSPGRGSRTDFTKEKEHVPGPGTYRPDSPSKAIGIKIGLSERNVFSGQSDTPAPGTYDIPSKISETPTFTIGRKSPEKHENGIPGPGEYNAEVAKLKDKSPQFSISKAPRKDMTDTARVANPGPGAYEAKRPTSAGPQWKFGSESRSRYNESPSKSVYSQGRGDRSRDSQQDIYRLNSSCSRSRNFMDSPGPGAYDPYSKFSEGPRFSIRGRIDYERKDPVPGPGSYETQPEKVKDKSPAFRLSRADRVPADPKKDLPGPGAYEVKEKPNGSACKFGSEKKERVVKPNIELGPGAYDPAHKSDAITYSFGSKQVDLAFEKKKEIPGPGSYEVHLRNESPSYSPGRGQRTDFTKEKEHVPGPGSYYKVLREQLKGPKFSSASRKSLNPVNDTPAPGTYELPSKLSEGPSFSLYGKPKDIQNNTSPGPGSYNPELKNAEKSPCFSVSKSKRIPDANKTVPGPGSYEVKRPSSAQPSYKFGSEAKSLSFRTRDNQSPGPGTYNLKSTLSRLSFSMSAKFIDTVKDTPGPGTYTPVLSNRSPSYNIGKGQRHDFTRESRDNPGPGAYDSLASTERRNGSPGTKFSQDRRRTMSVGDDLPGPGSYYLPSKLSEGPLYSIYVRRDPTPQSETPGPGHYELPDHKVRDSSPSFKIGRSERASQVLNSSFPGPGHYDSCSSLHGPKHVIGKESRSRDLTSLNSPTPGPGSYSVQSLTKSKGFTISGKPNDQNALETPGPGSYDVSQSCDSPAYKIGTSNRHDFTKERSISPGPGAYKPKDFLSRSGGIFGKAKKSLLSYFTESPGPASYNISVHNEAPSYSMNSRTASPTKPGVSPQGESSSSQIINKKSPASKIASSKRPDNSKSDSPGPVKYEVRKATTGPKLAKARAAKKQANEIKLSGLEESKASSN